MNQYGILPLLNFSEWGDFMYLIQRRLKEVSCFLLWCRRGEQKRLNGFNLVWFVGRLQYIYIIVSCKGGRLNNNNSIPNICKTIVLIVKVLAIKKTNAVKMSIQISTKIQQYYIITRHRTEKASCYRYHNVNP